MFKFNLENFSQMCRDARVASRSSDPEDLLRSLLRLVCEAVGEDPNDGIPARHGKMVDDLNLQIRALIENNIEESVPITEVMNRELFQAGRG